MKDTGRDRKRNLRARAITALGSKCIKCAHSEPSALYLRCENPYNMRGTSYQHYRSVLKPGNNKYAGYYLICSNCYLASKHSNTSTSLSI